MHLAVIGVCAFLNEMGGYMKVTKKPFVLISVILAMFMGAVEATIIATAMPSITADLGGFSRYSWVFSSYLLMSTILF